MSVAKYIQQLQSYEEYSFSWAELLLNCSKSEIALKRELSRLVEKKRIVNLRKEFYLIIPARYSNQGQIPIQLYVHKLFKSLNRNYYLSFYSAAKFYGASHQQSQQEYVMIDLPKIRDVERNGIVIRFLTCSQWSKGNIVEKKSDAGVFRISSPALTAVNLIQYQNKIGGINRVLAVLTELIEEITKEDLSNLLSWYTHKSTLQRFGFLLDTLDPSNEISNLILEYLKPKRYFPILLVPKAGQKAGKAKRLWKVDLNTQLENDL